MELFVEYQVPSDLLPYDDMNGSSASVMEKVDSVRGNVKAVMNMIEGTKEKQLEEKLMREEAAKAAKEQAIRGGDIDIASEMFQMQSLTIPDGDIDIASEMFQMQSLTIPDG